MATKINIYGAVCVTLTILLIAYMILRRNGANSNVTHAAKKEYVKNLRMGGMSPNHPDYLPPDMAKVSSHQDIESCRPRALQILTGKVEKTNETLREARACWENTLVFYLSYPVDFGFGSHELPLVASLWVSQGSILELGSGWYSTPIAHRVADLHKRYIHTVDSKYDWLKYFVIFASNTHHLSLVSPDKNKAVDANVRIVDSWEAIGGEEHWGFIFVDQAPASQRRSDLVRLRTNGDLLLVHDSEPVHDGIYELQKPLETFKYRTTFGPEWTGTFSDVVSDTHPELISAIETICKWGIERMEVIKY